jgi:hypothetical protein
VKAALLVPRPVPGRRVPTLVGAAVVGLALPVFLIAGFPVRGWALAAFLWAAAEALGRFLERLPIGADNLGSSAAVGLATPLRGLGVMIVLLVITTANKPVGVSAFVVYVLAYTLSLVISLIGYFTGGVSGQ